MLLKKKGCSVPSGLKHHPPPATRHPPPGISQIFFIVQCKEDDVAIFSVKKWAKTKRGVKSYDCFSWEKFHPKLGEFPSLNWEEFPIFVISPPTEIELFFFTNISQLVFLIWPHRADQILWFPPTEILFFSGRGK